MWVSLRTPLYLDLGGLVAQAEYHGLDVPRHEKVVATTTRKRQGGGKVALPAVGGANVSLGSDVAFQSSYSLRPSEKATVSKIIDSLIGAGVVTQHPDASTVLSKDDLVEVEGTTRLTAASLAGKMFYLVRRIVGGFAGNFDELFDLDLDDAEAAEQIKDVFLRNELLPIPVLLELVGTDLPQKVFVNLSPDHFVDASSSDRIEGDLRVLGSVSHLVEDGREGYLSAERWLLHDWERLVRRHVMLSVEDVVKDLFKQLDLAMPDEDVHSYISGPAVIVDAIAVY